MAENPFQDITDPAELLALVQDGVECERCRGKGYTTHWYAEDEIGTPKCPTCSGTGKTPLPNPDLDALAACWCEGEWVQLDDNRGDERLRWQIWVCNEFWYPLVGVHYNYQPTTDPVAAMRLQEKYKIGTQFLEEYEGCTNVWIADQEDVPVPCIHEFLCRAIAEAALITALTEAMEKGDK